MCEQKMGERADRWDCVERLIPGDLVAALLCDLGQISFPLWASAYFKI